MSYDKFLKKKEITKKSSGFSHEECNIVLNHNLRKSQKYIVDWALQKGSSAVFADTGFGKMLIELAFAESVVKYTHKPVLILAPIAIGIQMVQEALKFQFETPVKYINYEDDIFLGINIINYEKLHRFEDLSVFGGVVLDESSILKSFDGKTRTTLIERFAGFPFKLAATATPSPNDYTELGNHAEFLGVMKFQEMLAMFFINDMKIDSGSKWRLKKHCKAGLFWKWVSSWACVCRLPSDVHESFLDEDSQFDIIPYVERFEVVETDKEINDESALFKSEASGLSERITARRITVDDRVNRTVEIIAKQGGKWIVWCARNDESTNTYLKLKALGLRVVEVSGADSFEKKEEKITGLINGEYDIFVTKPSIAGFGLNLQFIHNMIFNGLSDSFESVYQCIRRCYRFGQTNQVNVYYIVSDIEGSIMKNVVTKQQQSNEMFDMMIRFNFSDFSKTKQMKVEYNPTLNFCLPSWCISQ